jgi:hypothetical protein
MLVNDSVTIAVEIPVFLTREDLSYYRSRGFDLEFESDIITGHIDFLQVRNGYIHLLDYKPAARKETHAHVQLTIYALALARRASLPLKAFKCGWFDEKQSKSRLSTEKIMSTGPAPQLPSDEADLEQLERESQWLVAEIRSAGAVGGSQQIAAFIKRLVEWEDWFLSLQSRAGELEAAGLPRYSRRLLKIQKDFYGAKKIYLEMYADAVKSEHAIRQTWNDANRESIRIVSEQLHVRSLAGRSIICAMTGPAIVRKRGNPNWCRPNPPRPALATEFEIQVRQLRLTVDAYVYSAELRSWCERNRNRVYIPEWLLDAWDIPVEPNFSDAA